MPSIVKVTVHAARGLPALDATGLVGDTYVEVWFGKTMRKTPVTRSANGDPVFNAAIKIEVQGDADLSSLPLVLRVLDRASFYCECRSL